MKNILRKLLLFICLCLFIFSGYKVINYYYGTLQANKLNSNLVGMIKDEEDGRVKSFFQKYEELLKKNSDMVAWIKIEDTKLNYPVMITPNDEEYYLRRNFNKEYEFRGTLFLNKEANLKDRDDNIVIYGHNMDDGTMFGSLRKYVNKDYYLNHKTIQFETEYESSVYEIAYVFRTVDIIGDDLYLDYYTFFNADSSNEFNNQMNLYERRSYYDTGVTPRYGDKLITLSTCEYTEDNGRLVIVARKMGK